MISLGLVFFTFTLFRVWFFFVHPYWTVDAWVFSFLPEDVFVQVFSNFGYDRDMGQEDGEMWLNWFTVPFGNNQEFLIHFNRIPELNIPNLFKFPTSLKSFRFFPCFVRIARKISYGCGCEPLPVDPSVIILFSFPMKRNCDFLSSPFDVWRLHKTFVLEPWLRCLINRIYLI